MNKRTLKEMKKELDDAIANSTSPHFVSEGAMKQSKVEKFSVTDAIQQYHMMITDQYYEKLYSFIASLQRY